MLPKRISVATLKLPSFSSTFARIFGDAGCTKPSAMFSQVAEWGSGKLRGMEGIVVKTNYVKGGSWHYCCFSRSLGRCDTHRFAFRETPIGEQEVRPTHAGQCFVEPTLSYCQQVRFEGERPAVVWWYNKMLPVERASTPNEGNILQVSWDGIVECKFTQLHGGLYSGIAWRWKD